MEGVVVCVFVFVVRVCVCQYFCSHLHVFRNFFTLSCQHFETCTVTQVRFLGQGCTHEAKNLGGVRSAHHRLLFQPGRHHYGVLCLLRLVQGALVFFIVFFSVCCFFLIFSLVSSICFFVSFLFIFASLFEATQTLIAYHPLSSVTTRVMRDTTRQR